MAVPLDYSVGVLHGWHGVLLGLLASLVFLVSGRQDLRLRFGIGSAFWFLLAVLSSGGVIWLGIGARIWGGALLGVMFFCLEVWLIRRWWRQEQAKRQGPR
jgi:membrane associated rhomboid family serine protease